MTQFSSGEKMRSKLSIVIVGLLLLQACASGQKYTPMNQSNRDAIKEVQIYDLVIQDEIKPSVELSQASMALGGGLIGAMIDSSTNKGRSLTARDVIAPLYDVTENINYRQISSDKIYQAFGQEFPISEKKVSVQSIILSKDDLSKKVNNLEQGEALVYLSNFYALIDNFRTLTTDTLVFIYMNSEFPITVEDKAIAKISKPKKNNKPLLIYYNSFTYQSESVGEGAVHSIDRWSENDGQLFRNKLIESVEKTVSMLVYDLNPKKNESCLLKIKGKTPTLQGSSSIKGNLLKEDSERKTIRMESGGLISIASSITKKIDKTDRSCKTQGEDNV